MICFILIGMLESYKIIRNSEDGAAKFKQNVRIPDNFVRNKLELACGGSLQNHQDI